MLRDGQSFITTSDDQSDALCFDNQICFSLYSASNAMIRAYQPELKSLNLTYLQYIVMMVLWEKDNVTISYLCNKLHLDSGTLTPLLTRLEGKQFITKRISSNDERVRCVFLTDTGKQLKLKSLTLPRKILCKTALPIEQLKKLKAQCDELLSSFES